MARQKRIKSETGIYHVMLRGINKQQVFLDVNDYMKFLGILGICKGICGFKLHAYCLMGNHIHLLIQEGNEPLDLVFKRIGDRFAYWYNLKHNRTGPIFQGRFKSIPVNDDEYYISVLRYIHQNPIKAGLVKNCADYDYSSYNAYFVTAPLVDTDFTLSLMSIDEFKRIHGEICEDRHMDISEDNDIRLTEEEALQIFKEQTHCNKPESFQMYPKDMQAAYISVLRKKSLSIRQICRMTGASKRFVSSCQ